MLNALRENTQKILMGSQYALPAPENINPAMDDGKVEYVDEEDVIDIKVEPPESPSRPRNRPVAARDDPIKTDKPNFSGRINCPEQIDSEGNPRSILKLTCKTCDKRNICPMWQNTPPESQDGGQAATSPDDAGEIPWTGKATMIVVLKELQKRHPVQFQSQAILHGVDDGNLNVLNEEQGLAFYADVLKAANEGGEFA